MSRRISSATSLSPSEILRLEWLLADMIADLGEAKPDPTDWESHVVRLREVIRDAKQRMAREKGNDASDPR